MIYGLSPRIVVLIIEIGFIAFILLISRKGFFDKYGLFEDDNDIHE